MSEEKQPAAPEYTIRTIRDFEMVPADRLEDCLAEFAEYVRIVRTSKQILRQLAADQGIEMGEDDGAFTWIDDGKTGGRLKFEIEMPDGDVQDLSIDLGQR